MCQNFPSRAQTACVDVGWATSSAISLAQLCQPASSAYSLVSSDSSLAVFGEILLATMRRLAIGDASMTSDEVR